MTETIFVILHTPGEQDQYFIINMPAYNEKGHYTQYTSIGWFRRRELKRFSKAYDKQLDIKHCSINYDITHPLVVSMLERHKLSIDTIETFNSVYDFYDTIGYNRVKKRYSDDD